MAFWRVVPIVILGVGILSTARSNFDLYRTVRSNIERSDYAGSRKCGTCHAGIYKRFIESPMHNMTRLPEAVQIDPPFDGRSFRFKNDEVILEERDGQGWMDIKSPEFGNRSYRVTKVIGGHHREDFAGVEPGGPDSLTERVLPVSYMLDSGTLRYKGYSVMTPERPGLRPGAAWSRTCIFCHNTVPYLSTILGELAGPSATPYQGAVVDRILPMEKRWSFEVTDPDGLDRALEMEIGHLEGRAPAAGAQGRETSVLWALDTTRRLFTEKNLLEVGIGCESCHGGSREHAQDPLFVKTSLSPQSPYLHVRRPPLSPEAVHRQEVNRVCARCHQVLFSRYTWTWEGGKRTDAVPGGAHINSGEARDMLLGNCEVSCTSCHDPHEHDSRDRMTALDGPPGNAVCLGCHSQFSAPEALRAHSHHDPEGPGGQCLDCHMPRKNMSLVNTLTRYHRIGSPNDPERVERDRPLECAFCHGDKSVGELVHAMEDWWPQRFNRAALDELYGGLWENPIEATLRIGKPHEQAVALALVGQRQDRKMAPLVIRELTNPYPIVRFFADEALTRMLGGPSPIDLNQDTTAITQAGWTWLQSSTPPPDLTLPAPAQNK